MPKSYYPPATLKKAMMISKFIYDNGGSPVFRLTLAEELDYKSESRVFRDLITASSGYGLTSGSYASDKLALEDRGRNLAEGNIDSAFEALFSVEVFERFFDTFGGSGSKSIPSDKIAKDYLRTTFGIPDTQTNSVFQNIIQNARDWLLIQNIGGGDKFVPVELAKGSLNSTSSNTTENTILKPIAPDTADKKINKVNVSPGLQLNVQIHIASDTPDSKIETIFKNMRKYLINDGE